jgi:signal transduction histidine kinase
LSGDESFLGPYNAAPAEIRTNLEHLRELTADNSLQQERMAPIDAAIGDRMRTLDENLKLGRTGGLENLVRSGRLIIGKDQMDRVRDLVAEIEREEDRLLAIRIEESQASGRRAYLTFAGANLFVLLLIGFSYYLVGRDLAARRMAAQQLREANQSLDRRVRERTAELNRANVELERSNRELQDFAFVASHDLQEPLRKIQAFGDRLKTKHGPDLNDQARDYLERMQNAAGRMHTLINDLLTFSRVTTKAQPFRRTDLNKIVHEVTDDLEARIQQTGGRVDTGELPEIDADPTQMRQLFQNLIGNALKFHKPGLPPIVKVSSVSAAAKVAGELNGRIVVEVEDNGIGFDEKYLDRIFTPFQRLHGRGEYEGTGIGLAVCRKIVERHGGAITAESAPGSGSKFRITLPARHEKEQE